MESSIKNMFEETYFHDKWGLGESKSGIGSSLDYTINFRREFIKIIKEYNLKKIIDLSCGDWNWMKTIKDSLPSYIGVDVVEPLIKDNLEKYGNENISFVCNDMLSELEKYGDSNFDLVVCRHTFEHLEMNYIIKVLNQIKKISKYALITSSKEIDKENFDFMMDGSSGRMIDLSKQPYLNILGDPTYRFFDHKGDDQIDVVDSSIGCFGYLYKF
jgi:ubiquinone/menaquinone biosynthesis C-methylase UbiE